MKFLLLTYFFYNYIKKDEEITLNVAEEYDATQYYFFTNFLTSSYLIDIQIALRFQIKTEYSYTDLLSPLEILLFFEKAMKIEEDKKKELEKYKNESSN